MPKNHRKITFFYNRFFFKSAAASTTRNSATSCKFSHSKLTKKKQKQKKPPTTPLPLIKKSKTKRTMTTNVAVVCFYLSYTLHSPINSTLIFYIFVLYFFFKSLVSCNVLLAFVPEIVPSLLLLFTPPHFIPAH